MTRTYTRAHRQTHVSNSCLGKRSSFTYRVRKKGGGRDRISASAAGKTYSPRCRVRGDVARSDSAGKARRLYSYLQAVYYAKPYNQLPHAAEHQLWSRSSGRDPHLQDEHPHPPPPAPFTPPFFLPLPDKLPACLTPLLPRLLSM